MDFNPRSPCGERQSPQTVREGVITYFNPRSPCGERLAAVMIDGEATLFQSTLSLRRATGHPIACHTLNDQISIHALLAESDDLIQYRKRPGNDFNPRSPCGERLATINLATKYEKFQSTLSLRRAT